MNPKPVRGLELKKYLTNLNKHMGGESHLLFKHLTEALSETRFNSEDKLQLIAYGTSQYIPET